MKYKFEAEVTTALRDYPQQLAALETIPLQIQALKLQADAIRSACTDGTPVAGGTNRREDAMIDNIFRRECKERELKIARIKVAAIEKALRTLTDTERRVVEVFYIHRLKNHIDLLCEELGYEPAHVYRIKDLAILKLAKALSGHAEG